MFAVNALVSLFVGVPAIVGWIRYKRIQPAFYPFICWLTLGLINEITSICIIYRYGNNAVSYNIFAMLSPVLITYQLNRWKQKILGISFFYAVATFSVLLFLTEWLLRGSFSAFCSYAVIISSTVIVLINICFILRWLPGAIDYLYRDAISLICFGFIILYTYTITTECFLIFVQENQSPFFYYIPTIFLVINLLVNLLFLFAILWIPLKIQYFLRRSLPV